MNEAEAREQLTNEGFQNISVFQDSPNKFYPDHVHMALTAHIILEGEMTLDWGEEKRTYKKGDRFDIEKNDIHNAVMGPEGCTYMIGSK
tara:strand:- start:4715 stop:4981 length:267 start_codon:yes stop_codon:yes gene_type:complete